MHENARSFDVAQEFVSQADAVMRALDQPGQIGQHEGPFAADCHQAKIGMFGCERIVGNFRLRLRQSAQQRGFAGVRQANESGVGDDFQFQDDPAFLAGVPG